MTARQAADRGHETLLTNHVYPKFYSHSLVGGGNIVLKPMQPYTRHRHRSRRQRWDVALSHQSTPSTKAPSPTQTTSEPGWARSEEWSLDVNTSNLTKWRPDLIENYTLRLSQLRGSTPPSLMKKGLRLSSGPPCTTQLFCRRPTQGIVGLPKATSREWRVAQRHRHHFCSQDNRTT